MKQAIRKKSPAASRIEMREIVMPQHANPQNSIFGGQIMSWIDIAAGMAAGRHAGKAVVTVNVDNIYFKTPVKVGEHICIKASVNYVKRTSMEVGVKVISENPITGETKTTTTAYLTFVALGDDGRPTKVIPLDPQSKDDKRRCNNAKIRAKNRLAVSKNLKNKKSKRSV